MAKEWRANVHPILVAIMERVLADMAAQGKQMVVTDGFRSPAEQEALYQQGRSKPGAIVTNLRLGMHNLGLGLDAAFRTGTSGVTWDKPAAWWLAYGQTAEKYGLVWGGRWKSPVDRPHVQLIPVAAQSQAIAAWKKSGTLAAVWSAVAAHIPEKPEESMPEKPTKPATETPSAWAKEPVEWAVKEGITTAEGLHEPATKEQVITLIYRALKDR